MASQPVPDDRGPAGSSRGERPGRKELGWRDLIQLVPDVLRLFRDVARDPRVSPRAKFIAGAVGVYIVSPIDVIPDVIPVAGQIDDLTLAVWGLRQLLQSAGYDILRDLWSGTDDGFIALLVIAGIEE